MSDAPRAHASHRRIQSVLAAAVLVALLAPIGAVSGAKPPAKPFTGPDDNAVFFASDGMRQDLVEKYAAQGIMPTMSGFLSKGTKATGNGLLTQAPPNTGAGWYSLATGAWPGIHGSTNNTFHTNGQSFGQSRTAAFDPNVLQVESIAQSAERGGLKVAQVEWAGGRNATIQGPTIDFQSFLSGRGVADELHRHGRRCPVRRRAVHRAASASSSTTRPATRRTRPASPEPRRDRRRGRLDRRLCRRPTARRRRCACASSMAEPAPVDKYGLNAYIFDSTNDGTTNYDKVLFSKTKSGSR